MAKTQRIEVIDVLRGFTLLGIGIIHFTEQYYAGAPPEEYQNFTTHNLFDQIVMGFVSFLISGKFFMIFSFLFGLSFAIQLNNNQGDPHFVRRFIWRLIILFAIGAIHHLHYRGDILTIYAMLGFLLPLFIRVRDKWLLIIAAFLIANVPTFLTRVVEFITHTSLTGDFFETPQSELLQYYNTVKSGTYFEILKANFFEFKSKMQFQVGSGRIYITFGLFLLGLYAGRKNIFAQPEIFKKWIKWALWAFLICFVVLLTIGLTVSALKIEMDYKMWGLLGGMPYDLLNAAMATIYVSLTVILFQKEKWQKRLLVFLEAGRMGLTTYVMQTVFGTLIFFSYGLGLLGEFGAGIAVGIALVVFTLQIAFSKWWFTRFQYGPLEWVWRRLTAMGRR